MDERRIHVPGSPPAPARVPWPALPKRPACWQWVGNPSSPSFNQGHICANANLQLGIVSNKWGKDICQSFGKLGVLPNFVENATCKPSFRIIQPFLQGLWIYFDKVKNSVLCPQHLQHQLMLSRDMTNVIDWRGVPSVAQVPNYVRMLSCRGQDACLQLK